MMTIQELINRPDHSHEIHTLQHMVKILERHTENEEAFTSNQKQFVYAISRWFQTRPTPCNGYDFKTKCGRPTVSSNGSHPTSSDVCEECRNKHWEKNPPVLSKVEQRIIDKVESLYQEILARQSLTHKDVRDFYSRLRTCTKKAIEKDHMVFYLTKLGGKYDSDCDALVQKINKEIEYD